jgi:type VI protein secretion system component Hcp
MTDQTKKPDKSAKRGAVELADDRLDRATGGSRSYAPVVFKKHIDKATP